MFSPDRETTLALLETPDPLFYCDWVVNCIGNKKPGRDDKTNNEWPAAFYRTAARASCKGFLHVSSVAAETGLESRYGLTKRQGDDTLQAAEIDAVTLCILRPPILIGKDAPGLFGKLRKAAMYGIPLPFRGTGNRRSFMHVDNFAAAVVTCIKSNVGGVHLTTDSEPVEPAELYHMMLAACGKGRRTFSLTPLGRAVLKYALGRRGRSMFSDAAFSGVQFQQRTGLRYPLTLEQAVAESMA